MARDETADWWYRLSVSQRKEILKEYGAYLSNAKLDYPELGCYATAVVRKAYREVKLCQSENCNAQDAKET